jgi:CO/xanthine dehydrogenase Mo-binding subunit
VRACKDLRAAVESAAGSFPKTIASLRKLARQMCDGKERLEFTVQYEPPPEVKWDDVNYRGDAYPVYGYAAAVVDLEIDKLTYEIKVNKLTTAHDVGHAIHPLFVEGQIMGGVTQALGYALLENPVYDNGRLVNAQFTNYIIPTALDTPPFDVCIVEKPYPRGPFGAKGVGELPMDVPGPAVAAAIHQATGKLIRHLPILPETLLHAFGAEPSGTTASKAKAPGAKVPRAKAARERGE